MILDETWIKRYAVWIVVLCLMGLLGLAWGILTPTDSAWRMSMAIVSGVVVMFYAWFVFVLNSDVVRGLQDRVSRGVLQGLCLAIVPTAAIFLMCAPAECYACAVGGILVAVVLGTVAAVWIASRFDHRYTAVDAGDMMRADGGVSVGIGGGGGDEGT